MSKATADASFVYADADGNEEVSQKELLEIQQVVSLVDLECIRACLPLKNSHFCANSDLLATTCHMYHDDHNVCSIIFIAFVCAWSWCASQGRVLVFACGAVRFASIYFSCAPENQGKPPGGQAAEAEKEEEAAAKAAATEKPPTATEAADSRCLYEDVAYSGSQAGAALHVQNLSECQATCIGLE